MKKKRKIIFGLFTFLIVFMIFFVSAAGVGSFDTSEDKPKCNINNFACYENGGKFGYNEDGSCYCDISNVPPKPFQIIEIEKNNPDLSEGIVSIYSQKPKKYQKEKDCTRLGFCWSNNNKRCYSMGARIIIEPEYKKQDLAWKDETYLYCGEDSTKFVSQKRTGETCENDFECQSNECLDRICQQKNGIKITEIYSDKVTVVRNLLLREKEFFYFSGLNKNYSIGFGENRSDFVFLINDETYILDNKTFNLDTYSQITVESILFENGLPRVNITLIESINPLDSLDSKDFYSEANKFNPEEIQENKSTQITGNIVEESNNGKVEKNIVDKLINFLRKLFGF